MAAIVVAALIVVLLLRVGPLANAEDPVALNRLRVDFAACPTDLVVQPGTNLYRECVGAVSDLDVRVTAEGFAVSRDGITDGFAVDDLPSGLLRLQVKGVTTGTVDVLSCRSYAQSIEPEGIIASLVPEIAYGIEPMTAAIVAQPYTMSGWPANRWQATAADPTDDQLADRPDLFDTVFRCKWFLLPPGSVTDRPGIVRSYTSTDTVGEPAIHVLGPGGSSDLTAPTEPMPGTEPVPTFDFRSLTDGRTMTTGNNSIDHYLLPAGSWTVTDRTTGRQATVDVGPGQTTRVVSVTAIVAPNPAPLGTPVPAPTLLPLPRR